MNDLSFIQKTRRPMFNFQLPVISFHTHARPVQTSTRYVVHQNNRTAFVPYEVPLPVDIPGMTHKQDGTNASQNHEKPQARSNER